MPWWEWTSPAAAYHVDDDDDDTVTLTSFCMFWTLYSTGFLVHLLSLEVAKIPLKILGKYCTIPTYKCGDHTQFSTEISYMLWSGPEG